MAARHRLCNAAGRRSGHSADGRASSASGNRTEESAKGSAAAQKGAGSLVRAQTIFSFLYDLAGFDSIAAARDGYRVKVESKLGAALHFTLRVHGANDERCR